MKTIVETQRLILREIVEDDLMSLYELDSDPEVHKFLGNKAVKTIEESAETIKKLIKQYDTYGIGRWAVIDKSTNEFMGWSGLKYETMPINNQNGYYDLGYRIKKKYWGKGIATETAIEAIKYGFTVLKLREICAAAHVDNVASNKILQKVGLNFIETFDFEIGICNWYKIEKGNWNK